MWSRSTASTGTGKVKEATEMRKRMQATLPMAFVLMLAMAACGSADSPQEVPTPTKSVEVATSVKSEEVTFPVKSEEPPEQTVEEEVLTEKVFLTFMPPPKTHSVYVPIYGVFGTATLEEMIARATVIVRATFDSVRPVGMRSIYTYDSETQQFDGYHGSLEFTFNVLEYLKGTGGNQVKGIAHGWPIDDNFSKPS